MTPVELVVGRGRYGHDIYVVPLSWAESATHVWQVVRAASLWADLKGQLTPEWSRALAEGLKEWQWAGKAKPLTPDTDVRHLGWYLTNVEPELVPEIGYSIFGHTLAAVPAAIRVSLEECGRYIGGRYQEAFYVAHPDAGDEVSDLLGQTAMSWRWDDQSINAMLGTASSFPAPRNAVEPSEPVKELRLTAGIVTENSSEPPWLRWLTDPLISIEVTVDDDHFEQVDEIWEAIREWLLQFLRQSLEKDPQSWDWELLAESLETDVSELTIDDWFEVGDYYTHAELYLAAGGPLPPEAFPDVAVWLEGTDLFDLSPLDPHMHEHRGEVPQSDHELWQTLNSVWVVVDEMAEQFAVDDPEVLQRLLYERRGLASYRRHVSPQGRILRKPSTLLTHSRPTGHIYEP